jgi:hypothetical protein
MSGPPQEQDWDAYPPGTAPVPQYAPVYGPPPGYAPMPYGPPPGYGWYALPEPAWPHGQGRPSIATSAAVLGFVTAGLTILVSGGFLIGVLHGDDDPISVLLVLGLPCAAGLIGGALRLLDRRSSALLFGSAIGCVGVLAVAWLAGALTIDRSNGLAGLSMFVLLAAVLPALTAIFSWVPTVRSWVAAWPDTSNLPR